jgi:peroxiredoxin
VEERSKSGWLWVAGALALCIFAFHNTEVSRAAPAFSLAGPAGGSVSLESGRPTLLVFWTTWCGVCRQELPVINRMAPEFQKRGIAVVAIHVGESNDIAEYLRTNQIDVTTAVDPDGTVGQSYHVSGVPKLVLIGADGKIKRSTARMTDEDTLEEWMKLVGS